MEQLIYFITDGIKTSIASITGISFGLLLDKVTFNNPLLTSTTLVIQNLSLVFGCIVAVFAIVNGCFTLYDNILKHLPCKLKKKKHGTK